MPLRPFVCHALPGRARQQLSVRRPSRVTVCSVRGSVCISVYILSVYVGYRLI